MMIRFLFWLLVFYLLFRVLRQWVSRPAGKGAPPQPPVSGPPPQKILDLSNADIEDAKFHEVKKKPAS